MRSRLLLFPILVAAVLILPTTALANYGHVVTRGESLASVAAADGLSVSQLAAANGLAPTSQIVLGSTLQIPPQGASSSASTPVTAAGDSEVGEAPDGDEPTATAMPAGLTTSPGGYVVRPGDTLSGIAAANGLSASSLAALNGLRPTGVLLAGSTISLGGGTAATGAVASSTPVATSTPVVTSAGSAGAQPTPETVSPSDVGSIAAAHGVSPSLAEAVGYQESGFNNNLVSSSGATGVMQIEPGTWSYIGSNLATPPPLSPSSAQDNIRGGVLLLQSLLNQTGGDPALAAAGYYQGLASVRAHGMYADTQRYVNNVMALRAQFGGP